MPSVTQRQMAVEKTPGYFHTRGVARRLWAANNKTKLIVIMRHPVTRLIRCCKYFLVYIHKYFYIISDYNQFRSNKLGRGETFPDLESLVLNRYGDAVDASYPVGQNIFGVATNIFTHLFSPWCGPCTTSTWRAGCSSSPPRRYTSWMETSSSRWGICSV